MKIDKSRFLLLTTTLAATAAAGVIASTSACTTTTTSTDAGDNSPTDSGSTKTDGGTTGDGSTTGDGGQETCLGNEGAAPTCEPAEEPDAGAGYDAGADAGSAKAKCVEACNAANSLFKTQVAVAVSACADKVPSPSAEACFSELEPCIKTALSKACADDTAAAYCTELLTSCVSEGGVDAGPAITQADCIAVVKALSGEGRASLTECVDNGTCQDCFDSIKTGSVF
jgi:hypothetical protein